MARPRRSITVPLPRLSELILTSTAAALVVVPVLRTWALQWGATEVELDASLPGDDLVVAADHVSTRAVTIHARPDEVWPWLVQMGQGRGGFYSYDVLENLIGGNVHSAHRIEQRWQDLRVGDLVHLHPRAPALVVADIQPGRAMTLRSERRAGGTERPALATRNQEPIAFSWAFVLTSAPAGGTRLVVRERYASTGPVARAAIEPVSFASFVMSQAMLRGLKFRVESAR